MTSDASGAVTVVDAPERGRYEVRVGGEVAGYAVYQSVDGRDGVLEMPHTVIEPAHEGQGLGSRLITGALDDVRRKGATLVPTCPFVRAFLDKHPDYADLFAS